MPGLRQHDDGQVLRARPVQRIRQRHNIVMFAVDNQRIGPTAGMAKRPTAGAARIRCCGCTSNAVRAAT